MSAQIVATLFTNDRALRCMVNRFWYYVRKYVIIEDFLLCPAGIIEQYKKFKMASKMAAIS